MILVFVGLLLLCCLCDGVFEVGDCVFEEDFGVCCEGMFCVDVCVDLCEFVFVGELCIEVFVEEWDDFGYVVVGLDGILEDFVDFGDGVVVYVFVCGYDVE